MIAILNLINLGLATRTIIYRYFVAKIDAYWDKRSKPIYKLGRMKFI